MDRNYLYPIFLKAHDLQFLIVGGGAVCREKLHFLLKSSPQAQVTVVAPFVSDEVYALLHDYQASQVQIQVKPFDKSDLEGKHIAIAATDDEVINKRVQLTAREKGTLVNVADDPEKCDFYMGGIVTKGHVKIGISTNGKSPTLAKRLRQLLEQSLPDEINELAHHLNEYRQTLRDDFQYKVKELNRVTANLIK